MFFWATSVLILIENKRRGSCRKSLLARPINQRQGLNHEILVIGGGGLVFVKPDVGSSGFQKHLDTSTK